MLTLPIPGATMPYIEVGQGEPLVLVHGSMSDFRIWSPVFGPLSRRFRVVAPSLRHFFPAHWNGQGGGFTIAQHTEDLIAFIEQLGAAVHLLGHSRGGHLAFRVAEARPDLVRGLILAEPGGDLDVTLQPPDETPLQPLRTIFVAAGERIKAGEIDQGLEVFLEGIEGPGAWRRLPVAIQQELRDNAMTLLGQVDEQRQPFTRASAERIRSPTLLIEGERTKPMSARNVRVLAAAIPGAQRIVIPKATHMMIGQQPVAFCHAVTTFLAMLSN